MEELVAAYALGSCDQEEREIVEAHLVACPGCRALAARLSQAADTLPLAVEPVRPPARLRARILAGAASGRSPEDDEPPARILTFPVRAERPPGAWRRFPLQWAAVAVLAVMLVALGTWNVVLNQALNAPPARYSMAGTGRLAGASGTLTEFRRQDAAIVSLTGMPELPAGKVYELWLIDASGRPTRAGVFVPSADGTAQVGVDRPLAGVRTVAITREDGPTGVQVPTEKAELAVRIA
jgi:anti-sigma-K factor RskA